MKSFFRVSCCGIGLLAGCSAPVRDVAVSARDGQVGFSEVSTAVVPSSRLVLADNERFQPPLPDAANAPPDYPPALLGRHLPPQAVCVRLSIDETGQVFDAAPVDEGPECATGMDAESAFFAAAAQAAMAWRFDPAFRCVFPEGVAPESGCGLPGSEEIPQPVSLVYRFVFEQVDGRGRVSVE